MVGTETKRRGSRHDLWIAVVVVGAMFLLSVVRVTLFEQAELRIYDLGFWARGGLRASDRVVLATIDEKSLAKLGRWPWPRTVLAELVGRLSEDGAAAIAFDVAFLEPDRNSSLRLAEHLEADVRGMVNVDPRVVDLVARRRREADTDRALAEAIGGSRSPVVLSYIFYVAAHREKEALREGQLDAFVGRIERSCFSRIEEADGARPTPVPEAESLRPPIEVLARATPYAGFVTSVADEDGVVRRLPLVLACKGKEFPSLAVQAVWHALGRPMMSVRKADGIVEGIEIGERFVPADEEGRILLNFVGPPGAFRQAPICDILGGRVPRGTFRDKVVFVGATALAARDTCNTPMSAYHPGVEMHATVVDNILENRVLERPAWYRFFDLVAILALGGLAALVLRWTRALAGFVVTAGAFVGYVVLTRWLFVRHGFALGSVYPLLSLLTVYLATTITRYVREERERRELEGAFGHYVAPTVIEQILEDPEKLRLGGEERVITVLFSDLAGFTSTSEQLTPTEMIGLLSEYFEAMTAEVHVEHGMLKEYVGDELMALFGAPLEQADHAERACRAALAMRDRLARLRQEWLEMGRPPIRARTGVNSGVMLVGNLGSSYRFCYGALGDNVNLGSRLEGINKQYGTEIIVGENTAALVRTSFQMRELDAVRVVGKKKPVHIFELLARSGEPLTEAREACVEAYAKGLVAYRGQEWDEALGYFGHALTMVPDDGPSKTMTSRCLFYAETPPDPGWDGVFEAKSK